MYDFASLSLKYLVLVLQRFKLSGERAHKSIDLGSVVAVSFSAELAFGEERFKLTFNGRRLARLRVGVGRRVTRDYRFQPEGEATVERQGVGPAGEAPRRPNRR